MDGWQTLPLTAEQRRGVTPRRLGGHLAGVAHYDNGVGTPNPPDDFLRDQARNTGIVSALPFLVTKPLVAAPGARFSYSSFGFNLLGATLERASGQSFDALVWKAPGGGLISSVDDLARYCAALDGNVLLSNDAKTLLWTSQTDTSGRPTEYGIGFGIGSFEGHRRLGHDGAQEKARPSLAYFPDRHLCVVVMTNAEYAEMDDLAPALERTALSAIR